MTKLRVASLAAVAFVLLAAPALAAKTDVVVLKNGDHLTGEVEQLERGYLVVKTDDLGTIQIEWDKLASVTASAPFDLDDLHGHRYLGSLAPGPEAGQLQIVWAGRTATVGLSEIVRMRRLDTRFWKRLDGSLDLGTSYTSASALFALDFSGHLGWERPGYEISADASSTINSQPDVEDTRRSLGSLGYERRFENRWVALVKGQIEQNRELGFDLRSSVTAVGGRYLVQSQRNRLVTGLGLSANRERPTDGESRTNLEATVAIAYDRYSYDFPKIDVSIALRGFAGLTDSGRHRLESEVSLKREVVRDFYATLRGYQSYDSRPASEGAHENDYGVNFALGWSF